MGTQVLLRSDLVICTSMGQQIHSRKKITSFSGGQELIDSQTPPPDGKAVVMFNGN